MAPITEIPNFTRPEKINIEFDNWLFQAIETFVEPRILLVGDNTDYFASVLVNHQIPIHLCSTENSFATNFPSLERDSPLIRGVHTIDFSSSTFRTDHDYMKEAFVTLVFHSTVEADILNHSVLTNAAELLPEEGKLIAVIPAFTALYNGLRLSLEEWKAIDRRPLQFFFSRFEILKTRYFHLGSVEQSLTKMWNCHYVLVVAKKQAS